MELHPEHRGAAQATQKLGEVVAEYTYLLSSQLKQQRSVFEQQLRLLDQERAKAVGAMEDHVARLENRLYLLKQETRDLRNSNRTEETRLAALAAREAKSKKLQEKL